jgi:hypothetical protein
MDPWQTAQSTTNTYPKREQFDLVTGNAIEVTTSNKTLDNDKQQLQKLCQTSRNSAKLTEQQIKDDF